MPRKRFGSPKLCKLVVSGVQRGKDQIHGCWVVVRELGTPFDTLALGFCPSSQFAAEHEAENAGFGLQHTGEDSILGGWVRSDSDTQIPVVIHIRDREFEILFGRCRR